MISPQITLWNQQGSQVIQGTLMVIPIEESLIYVRPLYLRAQAGRIPELTRVIVAYQNRIVMEPTLDLAIARLFGQSDRAAGRRQTGSRGTTDRATGGRRPPHRLDAAVVGAAGCRGARHLSARARRAARRRLGQVRRRDQAARRAPGAAEAAEMTADD